MFVHHVFFWLNENLTKEDVEKFEKGVKSLLTIETIKASDVGKPATTDRPIIDRSYSYSLLTMFENIEAHDIYQEHPTHLKFVDDCRHLWARVNIYDSETV